MIYRLGEVPHTELERVGGKARTLDRLIRAGYRVPDGLVITPGAFSNGALRAEAWEKLAGAAAALGQRPADTFAVRSSAVSEDSGHASFAGEFETVLNVRAGEELQRAIQAVYESRASARAESYAEARGVAGDQLMAVIVQKMVPADFSGVLFTADPITGSSETLHGNFVDGLGDRLVSGQASGESFTLSRPDGRYRGPAALEPLSKALFGLGERLADELDGPQDIEWAVADGRLWLLQSRPITTMRPYDPNTGVINDSKRGFYLWSNANFGEALPGVMTPLTWALIQIYAEETFGNPLPGRVPMMGNIAGRFYVNLSLFASVMQTLGFSRERMNYESQEFFGNLPDDIEIPIVPFSRRQVLGKFLPFAIRAVIRRLRNLRALKAFIAQTQDRAAGLLKAVEGADSREALAELWADEFEPYVRRACQMLQAGTSRYENQYRPVRRELLEQVGEGEANLLLSGVSAKGETLASLGPLLGLGRVAQGELSRSDYLHRYGHRGDQEMELSWPRPYEDPGWLDRQLTSIGDVDVSVLLTRREQEKARAWKQYTGQFPEKASRTRKKLEAAAEAARDREAIRSEITRLFGVARQFALRAGDLTGLGEDVFYLSLNELLALLFGTAEAPPEIEVRQRAHRRLSELPPYPALIVGRFDPFAWAADPKRRTDLFDTRTTVERVPIARHGRTVRGLPGSAGVVEGRVRRLEHLDQGHLLAPGEILVTTTTNVGWTPLFPRAAAVVTDVGAPLSHAAIVARELGLPAVVGAGDATMRLQTGDLVRVDGSQGTVELLKRLSFLPGAAAATERSPET